MPAKPRPRKPKARALTSLMFVASTLQGVASVIESKGDEVDLDAVAIILRDCASSCEEHAVV
jgi:hypothetical protein